MYNCISKQERSAMIEPEDAMLTTVDNPFSPFTQYDAWQAWDEDHGYFSAGLLAREAKTSNELSETDEAIAINQAIDRIVKENLSGMHKKVLP